MLVNEIFYSLQGEGYYTGVPAVFVRLTGCNLRCPFCDTDFDKGKEMSEEEIVAEVRKFPARHTVITGGEPTLQINKRLTFLLHKSGMFIQIETNGTHALDEGVKIDWITCSPKSMPNKLRIQRIDELKIIYQGKEQDLTPYETLGAKEFRLQPCDTQDETRNQRLLEETIHYVLQHPQWKLSLQTQKIIHVK